MGRRIKAVVKYIKHGHMGGGQRESRLGRRRPDGIESCKKINREGRVMGAVSPVTRPLSVGAHGFVTF